MNIKNITIIWFLVLQVSVFSQIDMTGMDGQLRGTNVYDYSKRFLPFIEVKVWGAVKNTGIYRVNEGTSITELLSFAGGLNENAQLDDIRLVRLKNDTLKIYQDEILKFNYEDLFNKEFLSSADAKKTKLLEGDVLIVPKVTSWYSDIAPITQIISILTSVATLVYLITRIR